MFHFHSAPTVYFHHLNQVNHAAVTPTNRVPACRADILYARWIR
jgi:hypothetical protein